MKKKIDKILTHFGDALCEKLNLLHVKCLHVVVRLYNGVTSLWSLEGQLLMLPTYISSTFSEVGEASLWKRNRMRQVLISRQLSFKCQKALKSFKAPFSKIGFEESKVMWRGLLKSPQKNARPNPQLYPNPRGFSLAKIVEQRAIKNRV